MNAPTTRGRQASHGILAVAALLGACSTPIQLEIPAPGAVWIRAPDPAAYPGAADLLEGFSSPGPSQWHHGDAALFAIEWTSADGGDRLMLSLEVLEPRCMERGDPEPQPAMRSVEMQVRGETWSMPSELAAVSVRVHRADGTVVGESICRVPRQALDRGFDRACARTEGTGEGVRSDTPEDEAKLEAVASLLALFSIIEKDPVLAEIFWDVVQGPSAWSVIAHLGVNVSLTPYWSRCARIEHRPAHLPRDSAAWAVPILFEVNDTPALRADLLVTRPLAPLHLCGGIIGIDAQHPEDPALTVRMVLLAARATGGPEAATSQAFPQEPPGLGPSEFSSGIWPAGTRRPPHRSPAPR